MRIRRPELFVLFLTSLAWPLAAQSPGALRPGSGSAGPLPGTTTSGPELPKPGGGTFFLDRHRGGQANALLLQEVSWGRLVDVHGLDAGGAIDPAPVFRDFLVGETIQSDGVDYLRFPSRATQIERLVVLRRPGTAEFAELVRQAERATVEVPPRAFDAPFVASLPRNASLSLHFGDLLEDGSTAASHLADDVRVVIGASPGLPFPARVFFDPNHGGVAQGAFHSTRVLIDPTVTEFEAGELDVPLPINASGLPPSPSASGASFQLRMPTELDPGSGQFSRLTNLAGRALSASGNAPVDTTSPTLDVVRAARAERDEDPNSGFLLDVHPPVVLGEVPVSVTSARPDPNGTPGFAFLVDWSFTTPCSGRPFAGDALVIGERTLEVVQNGPNPDATGAVQGVRVRLAQRAPVTPGELLGLALCLARMRPGTESSPCWFRALPAPASPPGAGVDPAAFFLARFSEAMRIPSFDPYENFRLVRGPVGTPPDALNTVVAEVSPTADQTNVALEPVLPLGHLQGTAERYQLELRSGAAGPTDLAGNSLESAPSAGIRLAPAAPSQPSAGIVLRFAAPDEVPGTGADLRGSFTYDAGAIRGRAVTFFSAPADRTNPVPSLMIPFPPGVRTPLSPFGSKLQSVYRYCDLGWHVRDESKYDVDVVGLDWAPVGGQVLNDFYPEFEIRLAHGARLPDEAINPFLLPRYPDSGVLGAPNPYTDNILEDPRSPQAVVHPRALGYSVNAADVFVSGTGTVLMPYPLNRGPGPLASYTWRDTSVQSKAGPNGAGVPTDIEAGPPLFLETTFGTFAPPGAVPSVGLPLLMEFRCYPNGSASGLNAFDVSLAINSSARPTFRAYSTGGIGVGGLVVNKDPDLELVPSGGQNPNSSPPGLPTPSADNAFYVGQLDLAYRITRVHSAWFDSGAAATDWVGLRLGATSAGIPGVTVEVRGATGFTGTSGRENDAAQLDAYGDVPVGSVAFLNGDSSWHALLDEIDGARFVQVRLTLAGDLETGATPALGVLALAFQR